MMPQGKGKIRRDKKHRILRPGETVRQDGKYQFKYHIDGKPHFVYSWKLEPTDKLPYGKTDGPSLRELEKEISQQFDIGTTKPYVNRIIKKPEGVVVNCQTKCNTF